MKTFIENKELTRRQARYLDILSEFNFQVIFRLGKNNSKVDSLTRMSNARPVDQEDERVCHQHQVILTLYRVDIRTTEVEAGLFERIYEANKEDTTC